MKEIKGINWYIIQPSEKELEEAYNKAYCHTEKEKECKICKVKFKYGRSNGFNCNLHKMYVICPICKNEHILNFGNLSGTQITEIIQKIQNNEEIYNCCSTKCRNTLVYQNQKNNKTGWCSKEAIMKKNSSENNKIRQQNALKRGLQAGAKNIQKQIEKGLHPTQNLQLQARKVLLMQLRKLGINLELKNISSQESYFEYLNLIPLNINGEIISYNDSKIYNNRCGAIGLTGICKKDNEHYALNAGKSVDLGSEIRKFYRIITQPEKQDLNHDYGRWFHIANDYTNFNIIILCVDVSEQEALLTEAAWAVQNNANFKYKIDKNGNKIQLENTHGYWM